MLADFYCTLSRQTDNGIQVLGGKLLAARVLFLELTFTPVCALEFMPSAKGLTLSQGESNDAKKAPAHKSAAAIQMAVKDKEPPAGLDSRWANAIQEAKQIQRDSDFFRDDDIDVKPSAGDIVHHQQFGECKVTRIGDDHITLRKPDGRNVQLGLHILKFFHRGKQNRRDVFTVEVAKKR